MSKIITKASHGQDLSNDEQRKEGTQNKEDKLGRKRRLEEVTARPASLKLIRNLYSNQLDIIRNELKLVRIEKPHTFLYADPHGKIQLVSGLQSHPQRQEADPFVKGSSLAFPEKGFNAVSLAMYTGRLSVVRGTEHTDEAFKALSSICSPIMNEENAGYLSFFCSSNEDISFCIPLVEHIVRNIAKEIREQAPNQNNVMKKFEEYILTYREMQVAYGWLNGKCVFEIAEDMGISDQTVRTFLKKIYKKTNVTHKSEFMIKFLDA